jgi:hypothetical protein
MMTSYKNREKKDLYVCQGSFVHILYQLLDSKYGSM